MKKVTEALAEWAPPARPAYDHVRYPYRYALDFLTGPGGSVIPEEIHDRIVREVMATPNAKGERRKRRHPADFMVRLMLNAWLKETGEDEEAVYAALADRYLKARGIERP